MKLIIAGGRNYTFTKEDIKALNDISYIDEVISGGAPGADSCGERWAKLRNIPIRRFLADWKRYGRGAGPIRNREMAQYADAVVLFPGGRGTESMYQEAIKAGIRIYDWRHTDESR